MKTRLQSAKQSTGLQSTNYRLDGNQSMAWLSFELKLIATNTTRMRNCGWHHSHNCKNLTMLNYLKILQNRYAFLIEVTTS